MGTATMAMMSLALKMTPVTVKVRSNGGSIRGASNMSSLQASGSSRAAPASNVASPMVATVRISRGALRKRRMMASSTTAPSTERRDDSDGHGDEVAPAPRRHQHHDEDRGHAAEVGLGEAEDAVGAVDEGHAQRQQCGEPADDDAAQEDARRHREQHELHRQDGESRAERGSRGTGERAPLPGCGVDRGPFPPWLPLPTPPRPHDVTTVTVRRRRR